MPLAGELTLILTLPDADRPMPQRLRLDADVRRSSPDGPHHFRVAVQFAPLSTTEEQSISQYLFRRMRELRRAKAARHHR